MEINVHCIKTFLCLPRSSYVSPRFAVIGMLYVSGSFCEGGSDFMIACELVFRVLHLTAAPCPPPFFERAARSFATVSFSVRHPSRVPGFSCSAAGGSEPQLSASKTARSESHSHCRCIASGIRFIQLTAPRLRSSVSQIGFNISMLRTNSKIHFA